MRDSDAIGFGKWMIIDTGTRRIIAGDAPGTFNMDVADIEALLMKD